MAVRNARKVAVTPRQLALRIDVLADVDDECERRERHCTARVRSTLRNASNESKVDPKENDNSRSIIRARSSFLRLANFSTVLFAAAVAAEATAVKVPRDNFLRAKAGDNSTVYFAIESLERSS